MEHVDELIAGQALYALSPQDEDRVVLHTAECERCRLQLREAEAVAGSLAYAMPASAPPPELRARLLAAVEPVVSAPHAPEPAPARAPAPRRQRAGLWPRISIVAAPLLAAAVLGLLVWNMSLRGNLDSLQHSLQKGHAVRLRDVGTVLTKPGGAATLYASIAKAPPGKTYEAWVIRGKVALPAGVFQGGSTIQLKLTEAAKPGDVIAITIEPAGGTKAPTSAPIAHDIV